MTGRLIHLLKGEHFEQFIDLMKLFGVKNKLDLTNNITIEIASLLPEKQEDGKLKLEHTTEDNYNRMFNYGCDNIVKRFEEEFYKSTNIKIN